MATFPFTVTRKSPELVVPGNPTPHEIKQLSDLDDQDGARIHLPVITFYRKHPLSELKDPAAVLRVALSRALVYYYPLAGRLVEGEKRKLMVDCNGEGVLFVEADADVALDQLGYTARQLPCPYMAEFLHDVGGSGGIVGCPLMLIQVTRLLCGGLVFAIRFNCCVTDAFGIVQFLNVVAEMARGEPTPSVFPIWHRQLLNARTKPRITCRYPEYEEIGDNQTILTMPHHNLVHRSFFFGPRELKFLQKKLPYDIETYSPMSPFDLVTACIWRSRTIALQENSNEYVMLTYVFNIRGKNYLNLPTGYYGGTSITTSAVSRVGDLRNNALGYAMGLVRQAKRKVSQDYVRSMMDLMVIKVRPPCSSSRNFIVSDASMVRFGEADFGWGKAISGGISLEPTPYESIYTRVSNLKGEDGISVPVCLPIVAMKRFEEEIGKMTEEALDDFVGNSRL